MNDLNNNYAVVLFNFFADNEKGVNDLISQHHCYKHFYDEYVQVVQPLKPEMFALLITKSSYGQIALAFNSIYQESKEIEPDKLVVIYKDQLAFVFAMHLFFNNFRSKDLQGIFNKFPDFEREFLANKQTGIIEFVSGESFWTLFFKGSNELKQELTNKALELHRSEVAANIDFNLRFLELTD